MVTFLSHFLLMTMASSAALHQTPAVDPRTMHDTAHATAPATAPAADSAPASSQPQPGHPVTCDVVHLVAPRNADATALLDVATATMSAPVPNQAALVQAVTSTSWHEPRWPPGATRSFLQVYRI